MTRRPNIVITMADDQRATALGCATGATADPVRTPHLDALSTRGTRFTHACHAGSNQGAVCSPSRAMLHSGRGPFSLPPDMIGEKIIGRGEDPLEAAKQLPPLLGTQLGEAGYRTHHVGKWHNAEHSFYRAYQSASALFLDGMDDHFNTPIFSSDGESLTSMYSKGIHSTELFSNAAENFIRDYADEGSDQPFFLCVAYTAPHDPRETHAQWHDRYPHAEVELPPNFVPDHPFDNGEMDVRDELLTSRPLDEGQTRREIADYFAMVEHMDHGIGRIHTALERAGLTDRTIVVHTADHGLAVGQHGLLGKQNLYDHSIRVPLILAGPGVTAGAVRDEPVYQHDLFPTLLDAAGVQGAESAFDSLSPELAGTRDSARQTACSFYRHFQRAATDGRYKLIQYDVRGESKEQCFDLQQDPFELHDLELPQVRASLRGDLDAWMQRHHDPEADRFGTRLQGL